MSGVNTHQRWVVFCRVVDNHGDLGVCWRLASQLAKRGKQVQLYVDDASALDWMAPEGCSGVEVLAWPEDLSFARQTPADVVIEAFGCELPHGFQAAMAAWPQAPVWINLEYFSAEAVALRNHGLPSPIMSGPAKGMTKWFYYPGLHPNSGGVMAGFNAMSDSGTTESGVKDLMPESLHVSLFCYEPASLQGWLQQLNQLSFGVLLNVTAGRATQAVRQALQSWPLTPRFHVHELPYLSHEAFDQLLAAQDLNVVRGEDSLIRAIWAGKPFLWQIYPQHDGAHRPKLQAFLDVTQAPPVVVQAHWAWNADEPKALPLLTPNNLAEWTSWAQALQQHLQAQTDLVSRLESFVATHG